MRVRKVCNNTEDIDVFFGSRVTRITEHHFSPATTVEQLLAAHPNDDAIGDNTDPCNVSLDDTSGIEDLANVDVTEESVVTTATPMSTKDNNTWYNAIEKYISWYGVAEAMGNYQEWKNPPIILKDTTNDNEFPIGHIEQDFYLGKRQT